MGDHVYLQRVQEHLVSGNRSGVRSTPTFFINGVMHDVSFGLERLQQAMEAALSR
jgi:protein-disulfide isomerase